MGTSFGPVSIPTTTSEVPQSDEMMVRHGAPTSPRLIDEARIFWSQINPRVIASALAVALAVRLWLGGWTWWDGVVVAAQIAMQPFVEWLIHVYILHFKPRKVFGREIDPYVSRKHREHHQDPRKVKWIFIPKPVLLRLMVALTALYYVLLPTMRLATTAVVGGLGILLTYEWTHYLIHSRYQPKTRLYRYIWRAHRLHHYKNEHYWFGVTMHAGDHVLRTFPDKEEVPTSPTCRTLGVEERSTL